MARQRVLEWFRQGAQAFNVTLWDELRDRSGVQVAQLAASPAPTFQLYEGTLDAPASWVLVPSAITVSSIAIVNDPDHLDPADGLAFDNAAIDFVIDADGDTVPAAGGSFVLYVKATKDDATHAIAAIKLVVKP